VVSRVLLSRTGRSSWLVGLKSCRSVWSVGTRA
jgi:hypothetical protein